MRIYPPSSQHYSHQLHLILLHLLGFIKKQLRSSANLDARIERSGQADIIHQSEKRRFIIYVLKII